MLGLKEENLCIIYFGIVYVGKQFNLVVYMLRSIYFLIQDSNQQSILLFCL